MLPRALREPDVDPRLLLAAAVGAAREACTERELCAVERRFRLAHERLRRQRARARARRHRACSSR